MKPILIIYLISVALSILMVIGIMAETIYYAKEHQCTTTKQGSRFSAGLKLILILLCPVFNVLILACGLFNMNAILSTNDWQPLRKE